MFDITCVDIVRIMRYNMHRMITEVYCMESTNLNIRTDKEVKAQAEKIFDALGLNMTTAVNIFLRQAIRENGIPFEVKLNVPNETTAAAIREGRTLAHDKNAVGYDNMADLRAALEV